jgi:hypothetical protein
MLLGVVGDSDALGRGKRNGVGVGGTSPSMAMREVAATEATRGRRATERKNELYIFHITVAVISPISTEFGVGGAPPKVLHEIHGVRACSTIFLELIQDGVVWS